MRHASGRACAHDALQGYIDPDPEVHSRRIIEELLAAGYRPAVWHNVVPPPFLGRGIEVLDVFDPFDFRSPALSPRQGSRPLPVHMSASCRQEHMAADRCTLFSSACCRLVSLARGWSPATHHHWPDAFKAAARTVLLTASRAAGSSDSQPSLRVLPAEVLLRILQLAAAPMSAWLPGELPLNED